MCVHVRFFFLDSVNGIPEPVLVGKRCSTANTGAAILLVHSGSGPLCVNKIELVLWFIYSFDHLGFFLTHHAVYRSISFSFLILKRTIFMSSKEVLIVMDNELQLWWLLHFVHLWPYYIYIYMGVCMYLHMYIYVHTNTHTHTYI